MPHNLQFYIDGVWVDPIAHDELDEIDASTGYAVVDPLALAPPRVLDVIDPSTGLAFERISLGSKADVDMAVAAAKRSFGSFGTTDVEERLSLLRRVIDVYKKRGKDLALAVSREMGAPRQFAYTSQVGAGLAHFSKMADTLKDFQFARAKGRHLVVKEPIGVVGLITPWNWPLNQIACKVAPALAAGCTMVLKPSELSPLSGIIFAEIMEEAGVPSGVFNLVNGDGPSVGHALAAHPDIAMISITGSTRAGVQVAKTAADTVKRVHQELGGKSPNILLDDVDVKAAVTKGVAACFSNSGQSCNAPTRMFVPRKLHDEAAGYAKLAAEKFRVGPPEDENTRLGPVVSSAQYEKIQALIESGIQQGATLVTGGVGRPEGLERGFYVKPTVFANVTHDMRIATEEIFGPVLSMLPYDSLDEAIEQANDTVYGLASYIQTKDIGKAREIAKRMRTGTVSINYPPWDAELPFGGYKQSGNGREQAEFGLEDFLELKGIAGYEAS